MKANSLKKTVFLCVVVFLAAAHGLLFAADATVPCRPDQERWPAQPQNIVVVDDRGRKTYFAKPPQRIVSLLPSLTESVCALDGCARLVAVDRYSGYPEAAARLPVVGGGQDPNMEAIVALRPDVVLMATSARALARLEALGLKVIALEPQTHADVLRALQQIDRMLGHASHARADRLWQGMQDEVAQAARSLPVRAQPVRVFVEVSRGPYAAGPQSFIGETLQQMGLANIVPAQMGAFPKLNPEFVLRADPDLLLVTDHDAQGWESAYPGWHNMRAVRLGRVCRFGAAEADILARPGPRMAEAARLIAQCVQHKLH